MPNVSLVVMTVSVSNESPALEPAPSVASKIISPFASEPFTSVLSKTMLNDTSDSVVPSSIMTVSYTHLTLPTICSV